MSRKRKDVSTNIGHLADSRELILRNLEKDETMFKTEWIPVITKNILLSNFHSKYPLFLNRNFKRAIDVPTKEIQKIVNNESVILISKKRKRKDTSLPPKKKLKINEVQRNIGEISYSVSVINKSISPNSSAYQRVIAGIYYVEQGVYKLLHSFFFVSDHSAVFPIGYINAESSGTFLFAVFLFQNQTLIPSKILQRIHNFEENKPWEFLNDDFCTEDDNPLWGYITLDQSIFSTKLNHTIEICLTKLFWKERRDLYLFHDELNHRNVFEFINNLYAFNQSLTLAFQIEICQSSSNYNLLELDISSKPQTISEEEYYNYKVRYFNPRFFRICPINLHWRYDGVKIARQTQIINSFICPICLRKLFNFQIFIIHLAYFHTNLELSFEEDLSGQTQINLNIIKTSEDSPKNNFFFSIKTTFSLPSPVYFPNLDYEEPKVGPTEKNTAWRTERNYFHSISFRPFKEDEFDEEDSENEMNNDWFVGLSDRTIDSFEEVSVEQKQFFKIWNAFIISHPILADSQMPSRCEEFVHTCKKEIKQKKLELVLLSHLLYLWDFRLIEETNLQACMQKIND